MIKLKSDFPIPNKIQNMNTLWTKMLNNKGNYDESDFKEAPPK